MKLRKALFPLLIVSKILCINPLSLKRLRPSKIGTIITICQALGYTVFHLWTVNQDMSTDPLKNLVRKLIDTYNRYSGYCVFCFLVITSISTQNKVVAVIQNLENVDQMLKSLDITVDNCSSRRYNSIPNPLQYSIKHSYEFPFH